MTSGSPFMGELLGWCRPAVCRKRGGHVSIGISRSCRCPGARPHAPRHWRPVPENPMPRWFLRAACALLLVLVALAVAAWLMLRGSLPALEGEPPLAGLSAPVTVQRDALGIVTIDAASEVDAVRALGYVHAQERY